MDNGYRDDECGKVAASQPSSPIHGRTLSDLVHDLAHDECQDEREPYSRGWIDVQREPPHFFASPC